MKRLPLLGVLALALAGPAPAQAPDTTVPPKNWWHLDLQADRYAGIGTERAYRELLAGKQPKRPVVVAIIDSGVDAGHEDLDDNLWNNPKEIPGNGKDDDGNGYVDDVHGWNFIGGRDGRNVAQDTYEVTRLYAALRPLCEGKPASGECAQYRGVKAEFEEKRNERREQLQQLRAVEAAVGQMEAVLKTHLGADSLTAERVAAIQTARPDLQQAQGMFMHLVSLGITPAQIREEREGLEEGLKYGFNPEFDPRPIVGDNYADPNERHYGNADVQGPDAEHGTHVAGIVGAERGNGIGIEGIAPAVRIMAIRAVPDGDERDKDVANAIRYAVDNGAHVINMSFGKAYSPQKRVVDEAVRYAEQKGVLLVHAAGNEGADLTKGANFPNRNYEGGGVARNWIEVGASAWAADSLAAPFSNYGRDRVDVFAPGVNILSSTPGNQYAAHQGTSMAAPVVSGLAALIMAYYPELSAEEVRAVILDSAARYADRKVVRPGSEDAVTFGELSTTGGVVNAYAALKLAEQRAAQKK
jgi:subtilisin family serine protease